MPGILFVYSDLGPTVSEDEYNDWYDNEHVPLCVSIPGFESWSRWVAVDGVHPTYGALYDLSSTSIITELPYTNLVTTRSEREQSLISRLALLDRRTYTLREPVFPPAAGAAYDPRKPGLYMSILEIEVRPGAEDDHNTWYDEEHIPMLTEVPGWVRSRRFDLEFAGATGSEVKEGRPPKHLSIHEWETPGALETA
ncbi:hypothetical protein TRAPUB_5472 [Trametes pubescens]|uniref:EthD domain-containing protein n=1 Tax=Trametes pubescens TaxID=154538 RepID=A0A1M2V8C2_TRAPU|nr:hypothetical protein TRAPUB_5472 [Trametes pubescens]